MFDYGLDKLFNIFVWIILLKYFHHNPILPDGDGPNFCPAKCPFPRLKPIRNILYHPQELKNISPNPFNPWKSYEILTQYCQQIDFLRISTYSQGFKIV